MVTRVSSCRRFHNGTMERLALSDSAEIPDRDELLSGRTGSRRMLANADELTVSMVTHFNFRLGFSLPTLK